MVVSWVDKYRIVRHRAFSWRYELGLVQKISLALGMASLTGLVAQIKFYLPFTPVPVTGQVFAVLLSGVLLGKRFGGLSQVFYAGIGAAGVPWFAGWSGGISYLAGITGGYIIGFMFAAMLIGWFSERYVGARSIFPQIGLMLLGVLIIYALGAIQVAMVLHTGVYKTMMLAVLPFIPVDIAKAAIVASISTAILPKASYNGEVDKEKGSDLDI